MSLFAGGGQSEWCVREKCIATHNVGNGKGVADGLAEAGAVVFSAGDAASCITGAMGGTVERGGRIFPLTRICGTLY